MNEINPKSTFLLTKQHSAGNVYSKDSRANLISFRVKEQRAKLLYLRDFISGIALSAFIDVIQNSRTV